MPEARCDCTGSPPWPEMRRLHAGGPSRFYVCPECGAVREDVYREGAIIAQHWHDGPGAALPEAVRAEALEVLEAPNGEQLRFDL